MFVLPMTITSPNEPSISVISSDNESVASGIVVMTESFRQFNLSRNMMKTYLPSETRNSAAR